MEDNFLKVAKQAALEAGKVIQKYSGQVLLQSTKNQDSSDFATQADFESEKIIVQILTENFPDHNIIAEEKTRIEKGSEYTWVIDPIDGTISFAAGLPYFAVLIGLLKDKKPILGVIYNVSENNLYTTQKGKGAYLNGEKIQVSKRQNLEDALLDMDFGHRLQRKQKFNNYVSSLLEKVGYVYSIGSAVPIALVAKGNLDGYVAQAWLWDFVAVTVLIEEAGGKVTDFEGREPDWSKERLSIVASNGLIHDQILEALKV